MPSFDIVSEVNHVEIRNAVEQCNKEIANRFDFKGSDARVEINEKEKTLTAFADDEFKLRQLRDVLTARLAKRGVDIRALEPGKLEPVSGNKVKETIKVQRGHRAGAREEHRQAHQGQQAQGPGKHPGRRVAGHGAQEGRAAGSDRAGAQVGDRRAAAVQEFPGLKRLNNGTAKTPRRPIPR